jgi:hypothetical protein
MLAPEEDAMYETLRRWTLAVLKAPPEPQPPIGDPASLRVFRAGKNYFRLRIAGWLAVEFAALAGLLFWTAFLVDVGGEVHTQRRERKEKSAAANAPTSENRQAWERQMEERIRSATGEVKGKGGKKGKKYANPWLGFRQACVEFALRLPAGAIVLIWTIKIFSTLGYLIQLPITYAVRRLDYEMRWYMVTDRSLRLRHGVWQISESTMSFANVQQVVVSQGPLQRLLGLADVKVKSAGGGGDSGHHGRKAGDDMHTGLFHSVTNATEIRDLIVERLRKFRQAGLGDPDEKLNLAAPVLAMPDGSGAALSAAKELATEARALRATLDRQM